MELIILILIIGKLFNQRKFKHWLPGKRISTCFKKNHIFFNRYITHILKRIYNIF